MRSFQLSDPYKDFTHPASRELLQSIINKQGAGLTGHDLLCVFNRHLPAGTAAECCAYLRPLFQLFRTPEDDSASQLWEDIIRIWLVQERTALEALNQYRRIIDELRRIVYDTLIPTPWQAESGAGSIESRAAMLICWMTSPWGEAETEDILSTLANGGTAQQFILLRMFLSIKKTKATTFAKRFDEHFSTCTALYDAALNLADYPLPPNDASGSTLFLKDTLEECGWYL